MKTIKKLFLFSFVAVFALGMSINADNFDFDATTEKLPERKINTVKSKIDAGSLDWDFAITGTPSAGATSVSFNKTDSEGGIETSYYKKDANGYWYHYKNTYDYSYEGYRFFQVASFYYNPSKCTSTDSVSSFACSNGRVSTLDYYAGYNGSSYLEREVLKYANNASTQYTSYALYNSKKQVIETHKQSAKSSVLTEIEYYSNGRVYMHDVYKYKGLIDNNYAGGYQNIFYNEAKSRLKVKYLFNTKSDYAYKSDYRTYHGTTTKLKTRRVYNYKGDKAGTRTAGYYTTYRTNGKKITYKRAYFKAGKWTKMVYIKYNKVGQTKSNKYGKAYKYVSTIKGKYVTKVTRAQYNKKGKLGTAKKVKITKETRTF
ncbi:hypothetical protein OKW23_000551 [Bacilli bacterium PM5-9]|nr:hypothetical protein [Bacilli bacterium PM5-9]